MMKAEGQTLDAAVQNLNWSFLAELSFIQEWLGILNKNENLFNFELMNVIFRWALFLSEIWKP